MNLQVNLIPHHYLPQPRLRLWVMLGAIFLLINFFCVSVFWVTLYIDTGITKTEISNLQAEITTLDSKIAQAQDAALLVANVVKKDAFIANEIAKTRIWHPLLKAIERAMVPGLEIQGLNSSANGDISLSGQANSVEAVTMFLGSLQQETGLQVIRFHSAIPEGSFQITLIDWHGRGEN